MAKEHVQDATEQPQLADVLLRNSLDGVVELFERCFIILGQQLAKDLVEAKYFSQKDPSGAMLQKMAIELAQKDSRLSGYGKNPGPEEMKKIIGEYRQMLSQPSEPADEGGLTESQRRLLEEAAIAIQSGKDRNAVIQRLVELGLPQDKINF